jgi:hypothetical protein
MDVPFGVDAVVGGAEAFLFAFLIAAFDCHNYVRGKLPVATIPVYRFAIAHLVWVLCGIAALAAFICSVTAAPDNWINQALSLGVGNNFARGFTVGTSVLVLIRSKIFTFGDSDFGGEYFYNFGRNSIVIAVRRRRAKDRDDFLRDHVERMMLISEFETKLADFVNSYIEGEPESVRHPFSAQLEEAKAARPAGNPDPANSQWRLYYRSLAGLAVDYCGASVMRRWVHSNAP